MSIRTRVLTCALAVAGVAASTSQGRQLPVQSGTGLIVGRVVDGKTGSPVTQAIVTIAGPRGSGPGSVLVDSRGRFVFRELPRGQFTLSAHKPGYVLGAFGKMRPDGSGQTIELADGERVTDATVRVWQFGAITGTVLDEAGEPIVGAWIWAYRRTFVAGRPAWSTFNATSPTDDRGMYRVEAGAGEYFLSMSSNQRTSITGIDRRSASLVVDAFGLAATEGTTMPLRMDGDRIWAYPHTFHPAARSVDAAVPVTLGPGESRGGVDLRVALTPTVRVSGVVTAAGQPVVNASLRLALAGSQRFNAAGNEAGETVTNASGEFMFLGIPAGQYVMFASSQEALSTSLPVNVADRNVSGLSVLLNQSPSITGRIEFDGTSAKPTAAQYRSSLWLVLEPADGVYGQLPPIPLELDEVRSFRATAPPGRYVVRVWSRAASAPDVPWTLKSVLAGGRDFSDRPLIIDTDDIGGIVATFSDRPSILSGAVRDANGAPDEAAAVLLFPTDRTLWVDYGPSPRRVRNMRVDRAGRFSVRGVPAGDYFIVAVSDDAASSWQDPAFLNRASRVASRLRIDEGQSVVSDLRTQRW